MSGMGWFFILCKTAHTIHDFIEKSRYGFSLDTEYESVKKLVFDNIEYVDKKILKTFNQVKRLSEQQQLDRLTIYIKNKSKT